GGGGQGGGRGGGGPAAGWAGRAVVGGGGGGGVAVSRPAADPATTVEAGPTTVPTAGPTAGRRRPTEAATVAEAGTRCRSARAVRAATGHVCPQDAEGRGCVLGE